MREYDRDADPLARIAGSGIDEDGRVVPFAQQVRNYAYGEMKSGDEFLLARSAQSIGLTQAGGLPVTMKQRVLKKVQADHNITLALVSRLPEIIREHPLALSSITERNALVVVCDEIDRVGNPIVVALHLAADRGQGRSVIAVDEVSSVYGKANLGWLIENTAKAGQEIFVNDKTRGWLLRTGVPFPQPTASLLYSEYTLERVYGLDDLRPAEGIDAPSRQMAGLFAAGWRHETMFPEGAEPVEVTPEMLDTLVTAWCELDDSFGSMEPTDLGCCHSTYWCVEEDGSLTALDNTGNECLVEDFDTKLEALDWLCCAGLPGEEARPLSRLGQDELAQAWASLGDSLVDDDGRLLSEWRDYPAGTDREDIWHDFDEAYKGGVHSLMFPSSRETNEPLGRQESDARGAAFKSVASGRSWRAEASR